jgi:hypothetical protein
MVVEAHAEEAHVEEERGARVAWTSTVVHGGGARGGGARCRRGGDRHGVKADTEEEQAPVWRRTAWRRGRCGGGAGAGGCVAWKWQG